MNKTINIQRLKEMSVSNEKSFRLIQRLLVGRENKVSLVKSTKKKIKQQKKKVD